jgi:hypothetical protein
LRNNQKRFVTGDVAADARDERRLADVSGLLPASFMRLRKVPSCRAWLTAWSTRDAAKLMDHAILFASHALGLAPCLRRDAFTVLTGGKIHD